MIAVSVALRRRYGCVLRRLSDPGEERCFLSMEVNFKLGQHCTD